MDAVIQRTSPLQGELRLPADKSICHRVLLLALLARGKTQLSPWPDGDDCQRTLEVIEQLGAMAVRSHGRVEIEGCSGELREPLSALNCGDSATTLRLAMGILAGQPFSSRLDASACLRRRPMRRIIDPLCQMGARIEATSSGDEESHPPLAVHGKRPLKAIRYEMPLDSAQVKSAILLSGLFGDGRTRVIERHKTRDHTERALRLFGVPVGSEGLAVSVGPASLTAPGALELPGDFSSAAFFIIAALCVPGSRISLQDVGLNPTRSGLLDVLERMGSRIERNIHGRDQWEPRGSLSVESRPLHCVALESADAVRVIDELPILMTAAACARGTSRFCGLGELRVKETDRLQSMVDGLRALGANIKIVAPDTVEIEGGRLSGAQVASHGDHRTAMSLAIAGLAAEGATTVKGSECVAKSYPGFFEQLRLLAGYSAVKIVDKNQALC